MPIENKPHRVSASALAHRDRRCQTGEENVKVSPLKDLCRQRALRCRGHLAPRGLREINAVFDVSPMAIHRLNARGGIVNG